MPNSESKKWTDIYKTQITKEAFEKAFPDLVNIMKINAEGEQKSNHFRVVFEIDVSTSVAMTAKLQKNEKGKVMETEHHASRPFPH